MFPRFACSFVIIYIIIFIVAVGCLFSNTGPNSENDAARCTTHSHFASCRGLNLTSVPTSLPHDIVSLDVSYNLITRMSKPSFDNYAYLQFLDLSWNRIESLEDDASEYVTSAIPPLQEDQQIEDDPSSSMTSFEDEANYSAVTRDHLHDGIGTIPASSHIFSLLGSLRQLDLSHNGIQRISGPAFEGLLQLQRLDLSSNQLLNLSAKSFCPLLHLEHLDLSNNKLYQLDSQTFSCLDGLQTLLLNHNVLSYRDVSSFPPDVFLPLAGTLAALDVSHNAAQLIDYSWALEEALSVLGSLKSLTRDAFYGTKFSEGMSKMTSLTSLTVRDSRSCEMTSIANDTFAALNSTNLTYLTLEQCNHLRSIEECAFCPLGNLKTLSLWRSSKVGVTFSLRATLGMVGRNITELNLRGVATAKLQGLKGTVLDPHVTEFLMQTCVSTLILADNDIVAIRPHTLSKRGSLFNRCLKHIDLSLNYILDISIIEYLTFFNRSTQLETFQGQDQEVYSIREALDIFHFTFRPPYVPPTNFNASLTFPVSPKLRMLNISASCKQVGPLASIFIAQQPSGLQVLDISYVQIMDCRVIFLGLTNLTSLNMSRSSCRGLNDTFFDNFPSLTELSLQSSNLNHSFIRGSAHRLFHNLVTLKRFDFSFNHLDFSLDELLHAQRNLEELRLAGNSFERLPLDLDLHPNLKVIDLSDNKITQLELDDRNALDRLASGGEGEITLHLHGNPLSCACKAFDFLRWMRHTAVRMGSDGNYACLTEDGGLSTTGDVINNLDLFWRRCWGYKLLLGSVVGMLLLLSLLGVAWGLTVNASRLRFLVTVFRRIQMPRREQFARDAYLAYCDADTELVCGRVKRALQDARGLRLLIKDLPRQENADNFWQLPGDNVAEKMLEHMDLCWKVVLVLTPNFPKDYMAGFTTRAALQSITDVMPHRVVLLCVGLRHVPAMASLRALLETVPESQVIFVPQGAGTGHPVWNNVADVILQ